MTTTAAPTQTTPNSQTSLPVVIDSTILSALVECPHRAAREYFQHWKGITPSVHLHAGAAYARGLEIARRSHWERGIDVPRARDEGADALLRAYGDFEPVGGPAVMKKTRDRVLEAYYYYLRQWPLEGERLAPLEMPNGTRAIEVTFCRPLQILHPSGVPFQLAGRFDALVSAGPGQPVWCLDDKTSSTMGSAWASQWETRFQFMLYTDVMRQITGLPIAGVLVRGLCFYTEGGGPSKEGYGHSETYVRFQPHLLQRYNDDLNDRFARLLYYWKQYGDDFSRWTRTFGQGCTAYGGCPFKTSCLSIEPDNWIVTNFKQRVWNPLHTNPED